MADVNNVDEIVEEVNKPLKESIKEKYYLFLSYVF